MKDILFTRSYFSNFLYIRKDLVSKNITIKNLFRLVLFLSILVPQTIQCQSDSSQTNEIKDIRNKIYITLSGGVHWGDGRLAAKPILFAGIGYYITNGFSVKIEYSPVIVEAKNNNDPKFVYEGKELNKGDEVTISEYFFIMDFKIFESVWFDIGFAPEKLFTIKTSLKYLWFFSESISFLAEYGLLIMGRPGNFENDTFTNSILLLGINYTL